MRKFVIAALFALPMVAFAQQPAASCLIVKHKGTVGRRLIWTALIGVPIAPGANYDYVDSTNFSHSKMSYKGKQLEEIQSSGTHVIVLDKFSAEGVAAARQSCASNVPVITEPAKTNSVAQPSTPPAGTTAGVDHQIEGYTLSGGSSGTGSVDGDQTSLGDAARKARAKKAEEVAR